MSDFNREISLVQDPAEPRAFGLFMEGDFLGYLELGTAEAALGMAGDLASLSPVRSGTERQAVELIDEWISVAEQGGTDEDFGPLAVAVYVPREDPPPAAVRLADAYEFGLAEGDGDGTAFAEHFRQVSRVPVG